MKSINSKMKQNRKSNGGNQIGKILWNLVISLNLIIMAFLGWLILSHPLLLLSFILVIGGYLLYSNR